MSKICFDTHLSFPPFLPKNDLLTTGTHFRSCRVRNLDQFHTYQLLSASARTPLLTLWTTSWCPTCRTVSPLLTELVESGVGEAEGGVAYCTVEYDAPDVMAAGLGLTYMINSIPTLLSFDAQEAQIDTKVSDGRQLADRRFLEEWCVVPEAFGHYPALSCYQIEIDG